MNRGGPDTIVCGTDFTDAARRAADVAAALAAALGRPLRLVHALGANGLQAQEELARTARDAARRALDAEAARLGASGADVMGDLRDGHADEAMVAAAAASGAALIVVAAVGTRQDSRERLGGIAERTAMGSPSPVVVVRDPGRLLTWLGGERPLRVFVAFDYSEAAQAALGWVPVLRGAGPCHVTVAYANWPDERARLGYASSPSAHDNPEPVQHALERSLRARVAVVAGEDADVIVRAARGRADLALLELAEQSQADLVVTGSRQQQGIGRLLSPSVSRGLLHGAAVSVATVPAAVAAHRLPPIPAHDRVLVATDFSPLGNTAIAHAFSVVDPGGTVRLLHVVHPLELPAGEFQESLGASPDHASLRHACEDRLRGLIPEEAGARWDQRRGLDRRERRSADAICREAELFGADVIVMGTQGRSALARVMLGSVARSVMSASTRPVFVVRAPRS
ncbi:MAG: universal stress protein [Vicinamibacterales bacterium]